MADDTEGKGGPEGPSKETLDALKEALGLESERSKELEKLKHLSAEQLTIKQDILAANAQNLVTEAEMLARIGQISQAAKVRAEAEAAYAKAKEAHALSINGFAEVEQELADAKVGKDEEEIKRLERKLEKLEQMRDIAGEEVEQLGGRLKTLKEVTSGYDNLSVAGQKTLEEAKAGFQTVATAAFGIVQAQNTMVGKSLMFIHRLAEMRKAGEGVGQAFGEVFNVANIGASIAQKVVESFIMMFTALDKASTKFAAATGTGRTYAGMLEDGVKQGNTVGVTFDNMGKSLEGLMNTYIGFTHMTMNQQREIAVQIAGFERLGIQSEQAADLMNTFTKTMGVSAQGSVDLTRKLALMGTSIGISSKRMIKDFQLAQKTLAVYGKGSVKVFTNMAAAAKSAGVEMGTLLGLAEKFDTFENAADTVGKLNALLGSQLSSTQMLMMTEDERIETVIQQIQTSGQSFAQMDRFKQKAIANTVGIKDMAEANKIFGMSMSQYRQYSREMDNASTSQEQMAEALKATVPIQEMFAQMMIEFAPEAQKLLEYVRSGIQYIVEGLHLLNKASGGTFPIIIGSLGMAAAAMKIFGFVLAPITGLMKVTGVGGKMLAGSNKVVASTSGPAAKGFRVMAVGLKALGKAGKAAVPMLLGIGGAVAMIGGGIYIAALGLAEFVKSFSGLSGGQLVAVSIGLIAFTVAFVILMSTLMAAVAGPQAAIAAGAVGLLWAIGGAALLMGIGVGIAAYGMSVLVGSLAEAGAALIPAGVGFALVGAGIALMGVGMYLAAGAMVALGAATMVTWPAMGMLILLLAAMGLVVVGVAFGFGKLAESFNLISGVGAGTAGVISGVGAAMAGMAVGLAAMMVLLMNPFGWLAIGVAMIAMSKGMGVFVSALEDIDKDVITSLASLAEMFGKGMVADSEATIVGKVTSDLESFKNTMDATLMSQIASLNTFQDVNAMNTIKAATEVQNQITLPPVDVNLALHSTTKIGDKKFSEHVHDATKQINWKGSGAAEQIYLKGKEKVLA